MRPETFVDHRDVVAFLENPSSYPHQPQAVHLIETPAVTVAVAPPYAYKVMKPVQHQAFTDTTTLEKRQEAAENELQAGLRVAQEHYVGVVPIRRKNRGLTFETGGRIVAYAVQMRYPGAE